MDSISTCLGLAHGRSWPQCTYFHKAHLDEIGAPDIFCRKSATMTKEDRSSILGVPRERSKDSDTKALKETAVLIHDEGIGF
eukprot:9651008-Karenia_brevis.AAC.1